jgi:hypothetical protein
MPTAKMYKPICYLVRSLCLRYISGLREQLTIREAIMRTTGGDALVAADKKLGRFSNRDSICPNMLCARSRSQIVLNPCSVREMW